MPSNRLKAAFLALLFLISCCFGGCLSAEDEAVLARSIRHLEQADMLIIGGTSLGVYPAAGLIRYFGGRGLIVINRDPTPADQHATLVLQGNIGDVLGALKV